MFEVGDQVEFIDWKHHARRANETDGILPADIPMEDVITRAVIYEIPFRHRVLTGATTGHKVDDTLYALATHRGDLVRKRGYALFPLGQATKTVDKYGREI